MYHNSQLGLMLNIQCKYVGFLLLPFYRNLVGCSLWWSRPFRFTWQIYYYLLVCDFSQISSFMVSVLIVHLVHNAWLQLFDFFQLTKSKENENIAKISRTCRDSNVLHMTRFRHLAPDRIRTSCTWPAFWELCAVLLE